MLPPPNHTKRGRDKGLRSQVHRNFVKKRLCIAWQFGTCAGPIDFAHCRDAAPNGHGGGKPGDEWGASMCRKHHRESEKRELDWGTDNGIDVYQMCVEFALASPDRRIREAMKAHLATNQPISS